MLEDGLRVPRVVLCFYEKKKGVPTHVLTTRISYIYPLTHKTIEWEIIETLLKNCKKSQ